MVLELMTLSLPNAWVGKHLTKMSLVTPKPVADSMNYLSLNVTPASFQSQGCR